MTLSHEQQKYTDQRFLEASELYRSNGHRPAGPWICAIPRPELDASSRVHFELGAGIEYDITAKTDQVAMMHVIGAGPGRVRLGYREHVPVSAGDMVLVNLREAGHWLYLEGMLTYWFTADVAMARIYRTEKPREAPQAGTLARGEWESAMFWNLQDVLNDYVVLGVDPNAEREMRSGKGTQILMTDSFHADGTRSDNGKDSRFPIVYRRVLGAGPGRKYRKEDELGFPDYVHSRSEAEPGDMMAYCKSVRAAAFRFQSMPMEIIHAASILDIKTDRRRYGALTSDDTERLNLHQSVAVAIPWDRPSEMDSDEVERLRGKSG